MTMAFQKSAGVEGGGFPVFVDERDLNVGLRIASDEGGDALLVKPLLNWTRTLVENPRVGFGILNQAVQFTAGIFEMEKTGRDEQQFVAPLIEELPQGVEFHKHPGRQLGERFR